MNVVGRGSQLKKIFMNSQTIFQKKTFKRIRRNFQNSIKKLVNLVFIEKINIDGSSGFESPVYSQSAFLLRVLCVFKSFSLVF